MDRIEETLRDVIGTIWTGLLGLPVQETPFGMMPIGPTPTLAGRVTIGGGWDGLVSVHCAQPLAEMLAGLMFERTPTDTTIEQQSDALGEITNMTGGNLKTVLAADCNLGQPMVGADDRFTPLVADARLVSQLAFECEGQPFVVSVFDRTATA